MHELSQQDKGARTIAYSKSDHLNKDKYHSKNVKRWYENLNEGNKQQTDYYYTLSLEHKGSSSELLVELPWKESGNDL